MHSYSDQTLVDDLEDPRTANRAIDYLYKHSYPDIRALVKRSGRPKEDAQDLFQDALLVFIDIVGRRGFDPRGEASARTFLYLIAYRIWSKKIIREEKKEIWEQRFAEIYPSTEDIVRQYEMKLMAMDLLGEAGEKCRKLLHEYYIEDIKISDLSLKYGEKESSLRQQISRCLKGLKKISDKWNVKKK